MIHSEFVAGTPPLVGLTPESEHLIFELPPNNRLYRLEVFGSLAALPWPDEHNRLSGCQAFPQ